MSNSYRWPILLAIVGIGLCVMGFLSFIQGFGGWSTSFQGPGVVTVEIPAAGDYRVWHASKATIDGRQYVFDDELPAGSVVEFTDARGNAIALQSMRGSMSQEIGSTRRVALGRIEIPEAGSYTVSITGVDQPRMFRLSEIRFFEHFLRSLRYALPGALLAMVGLVWAIVIAVRRRRRPS